MKEKPLVNLNVNPCKMCMPMGAVTALYGIRGCMSILHGSQGCATYIRRHMATHYNEPVDVASSSLTEQGTVFGGEANLLRGIDNLIALYHPQVVGVATTCLAETIGEDVGAILHKYRQTHPECTVKLISIASPGYGGTQNEGFFGALRAVVEQVEMNTTPHQGINIITPHISPADTRWLKELLEQSGLSYVLLPDLSENLDGTYAASYHRLPQQGTSLGQIASMAGARITIELSQFVEPAASPAQYLSDTYGVPLVRLGLPVGIQATDALIEQLEKLGAVFPPALEQERGRLADAMIDSHKYCAEARAAVFGEPDFVAACVRLCLENGAVPLVAAVGSVCPSLSQALEEPMRQGAALQFAKAPVIQDDCDFEEIESLCLSQQVNVMLGSSDGRRISHRHHLPLLRLAFPIHDRVGGQHMRMLGYAGSQQLVEQIANTMLARKEESFRKELYQRYYREAPSDRTALPATAQAKPMSKTAEERTLTHPCYNGGCSGSKSARIHLPVAPKCNIQCNYCLRKFDCPNESRPGVTTQILSPRQAADKYFAVREKVPNLTVVGIAGPGDALANFDDTRETLRLIREKDKEVTFCLSTNGLLLPLYAQELVDLGVSHVTITINSVNPQIGAEIYRHVDYMGTRYTGVEAASVLMANQLAGLQYLSRLGVQVKVNIVVLKGCNDHHVPQVVQTVKKLGACLTNIMQMIPVEGSAFAHMPQVSMAEIHALRTECQQYLPQMLHCRQCRADAIGTLDNDLSIAFRDTQLQTECSAKPDCAPEPLPEARPVWKVAAASKSGMLVDVHFGHADAFYIYESDGNTVRFLERRNVNRYCSGKTNCDSSAEKKDGIPDAIADCQAVTALRIGEAPIRKLEAAGIEFFPMYDRIEEAVCACARQLSQTTCIVKKG